MPTQHGGRESDCRYVTVQADIGITKHVSVRQTAGEMIGYGLHVSTQAVTRR